MGFISTGQTNDMVIYFTQKGMEYLTGKKTSKTDLSIKYFSLGDSDTNYLDTQKLGKGFVPDISGENTVCLKNTAINLNNRELYNNWLNSDVNSRTELPPSFHKSPLKK